MSKYVTFGEIMLRLKSPGHERFLGDFSRVSVGEAQNLIGGDASGRVQR